MTSSQERAAGSRSSTERTSSRMRANMGLAFLPAVLPACVLQRNGLRRQCQHFLPQRIKQDAGKITLAEAGQNDHDEFTGILGARGHLERGDDGGAGADADEKAFFKREAAGHRNGLVVADLDDFVDELGVEDAGNESSADALNLVGTRLAAG